MNWQGNITIKKEYETGYTMHDTPYCTYGKIDSKEECLKRCFKAFKRLGLSLKKYDISVYQSII